MLVDLVSSAPHYRARGEPILGSLPAELRGADVRLDGPGFGGLRWPQLEPHRAALVHSYRDLVAARRRGYRRIILGEHGIGQSYGDGHPSYPGGRDRADVGLYLAPNQTAADAEIATYPSRHVAVVGDPVLDGLYHLREAPGLVAVSFHWTRRGSESRSAFEYYCEAVRELARTRPVIGHGHPRAVDVAREYRAVGIEFVPTFAAVCERASLYVCDNSSTLFEFASTGRPVVVLNAPWYRREEELGLRFWRAADVGRQVDHPERLADTIEAALVPGDHELQREDALDVVYAYRSGAAARAADAIVDWLS